MSGFDLTTETIIRLRKETDSLRHELAEARELVEDSLNYGCDCTWCQRARAWLAVSQPLSS